MASENSPENNTAVPGLEAAPDASQNAREEKIAQDNYNRGKLDGIAETKADADARIAKIKANCEKRIAEFDASANEATISYLVTSRNVAANLLKEAQRVSYLREQDYDTDSEETLNWIEDQLSIFRDECIINIDRVKREAKGRAKRDVVGELQNEVRTLTTRLSKVEGTVKQAHTEDSNLEKAVSKDKKPDKMYSELKAQVEALDTKLAQGLTEMKANLDKHRSDLETADVATGSNSADLPQQSSQTMKAGIHSEARINAEAEVRCGSADKQDTVSVQSNKRGHDGEMGTEDSGKRQRLIQPTTFALAILELYNKQVALSFLNPFPLSSTPSLKKAPFVVTLPTDHHIHQQQLQRQLDIAIASENGDLEAQDVPEQMKKIAQDNYDRGKLDGIAEADARIAKIKADYEERIAESDAVAHDAQTSLANHLVKAHTWSPNIVTSVVLTARFIEHDLEINEDAFRGTGELESTIEDLSDTFVVFRDSCLKSLGILEHSKIKKSDVVGQLQNKVRALTSQLSNIEGKAKKGAAETNTNHGKMFNELKAQVEALDAKLAQGLISMKDAPEGESEAQINAEADARVAAAEASHRALAINTRNALALSAKAVGSLSTMSSSGEYKTRNTGTCLQVASDLEIIKNDLLHLKEECDNALLGLGTKPQNIPTKDLQVMKDEIKSEVIEIVSSLIADGSNNQDTAIAKQNKRRHDGEGQGKVADKRRRTG
ncbi:hypothetical protein F53441_9653 [Fusarium austroafricanum]|uniref:Uncharacterized protein n=1 Tax=Fusarium austroafricanum TaxID=2364996 RepID=A0A8H4KAJ6_9HYPO|nr:hypothetical protein F53441_9653 [Fusarium austroafricanum]